MVTRTEAIKAFLNHATHPDLAGMYNHDMEVQLNVAQDNGERISGEYRGKKWHGYTDHDTTWKPFRIPYNADTEPEYNDVPMKFDIKHAESIGMTGWDWKNKLSRWVAFDFDAVTGHSEKHQRIASQEDLNRIRESVSELPWVTVRYSTSGKGLHLYVMLEPVPTNNHTEHAALARAILSQMSGLVGYDFESKVDICGGNMWVWHRKMRGTRGLKIIKQGSKLEKPPEKWQQHINVTRGRNAKVKHNLPDDGSIPEIIDRFESLTSKRSRVPLDDEHKKLVHWLNKNCRKSWWWDADGHMLVCHTLDLKIAHNELNMRGLFDTSSEGSSDQNCFAFPMRRGAWAVRRYSMGVSEHASWDQDGKGWTRCFLNRDPDLSTAAAAHGAVEDPAGGYVFQSGTDAVEAALSIGADLKIPPGMQGRSLKMKPHKDGKRLVVEVPRESHDTSGSMKGWLEKGKNWIGIFQANIKPQTLEIDSDDFDDVVRHLVTPDKSDSGWVINSDGHWHDEPLTHIRAALKSMGMKDAEVNMIVGGSVFKPWRLVVKPFEPVYPGDREWNRRAPQFKVMPSKNEELLFPTWRKVLTHVGRSLDEPLKENRWAIDNGITTGYDYLKCWLASMIQHPLEPLPYLFIYGERQETGKSMFHEAASLLFTPGYQRADHALLNHSFNGELEGAILCVVEEVDLTQNQGAYNRIKDWVTSRVLPIHKKMQTPYHVPNTTHWVQCANPRNACPIFPGDTRITMVHVPDLPDGPIPKRVIIEKLEKEVADFLAELLRVEIPDSTDRLRIPVIETPDKVTAAEANRNALQVFIDEKCFYAPGYAITLKEFYERFIAYLDQAERFNWSSKQKVSANMPAKFPKGRMSNNPNWHWGNISFTEPDEERPKFVAHNDKLYPEDMFDVQS